MFVESAQLLSAFQFISFICIYFSLLFLFWMWRNSLNYI